MRRSYELVMQNSLVSPVIYRTQGELQVTRERVTTVYLPKLDFQNSLGYILNPKQTVVICFISMNFCPMHSVS
jgi:hypothetical protein